MTRRRPSPCSQPGCPALTLTSYCEDHTPEAWATSTRNQHRTTSGWEEQRINQRVMRRHRGICHWCKRPGADRIDHIIELAAGGSDTEANRAPIHDQPCHAEKTAAASARGRTGGGVPPRDASPGDREGLRLGGRAGSEQWAPGL